MEILSVGDLIELAENGKITGMYWDEDEGCHCPVEVKLDDTAKIVLHECLYMLKFEKDYYEREKKRNARQI